MVRVAGILLVFAFGSSAYAQEPQKPAPQGFLQQAITVLQAQRSRALDEAAVAEAKLAEAEARIAELEKQVTELKPKEAPPKK
jgi:hypothetical protein